MNKYGQYCPVARAVEILGDRWTLLIVRELLYDVNRFNDMERSLPGIPRALLAGRLRRLEDAGVVERRFGPAGKTTGYELTPAGKDLQPVMDALVEWGAKWAFGEPQAHELDPVLLLWWIRYGIYSDRLPRPRIILEFQFRSIPESSYWMILQKDDVSICLKHPGFDTDVLVTADLDALYEVWLGRITLAGAIAARRVDLDGLPSLVRAFPRWFMLSPLADAVRRACIPA
jgi:DNA-binding HxlR family transcriptional regulator